MAFPSSPANGQRASVNNIIYEYNDTKGAWLRVSAQGFTSANLTVGGIITDNYYRADGTSLLGVNKSVYNGTASATTSVSLVDSVPTAGNTSVSWSLTSKDTDNSTYKNSVVSSLNDGTNVYYSEYGIILSNASVSVSTFTSNIVSGNLRLYAVGDSANVTITFQRTLLGSSTDVGYITAGGPGAQGPEGNVNVSYGNTEVATYLTTYTGNLSAGATTIGGNLTVSGNLIVNGNVTYINANNVNINDSLIYLADDNPADTLDIGFVSAFTDATRYQHTGLVRDATDGVWKLFANVVAEPNTTVDFTNANYSNLQIGNLIANTLGIGTTTPSAFCHTTGAGVGFKHTNGSVTLQMYSDTTNGVQTVNGPFFVQTTGANPFIINTNSVERVRVDATGNVGIGTASPTVTLDVRSPAASGVNADVAYFMNPAPNTASSAATIKIGASSVTSRYAYVQAFVSSGVNGHSLVFGTNANGATPTEKMRIDTAGNVGIGTSTAASKVYIAQSSTTAYSLIAQTPVVGLTTGDYVNMAYFTNARGTNNDGLRIVNRRDSTGSGVGNWETESYRIRRSVDFNDGATGVQSEIVFGPNLLTFTTDAAERMRIDSSGNVGIGNTAPINKLTVSGGIELTGSAFYGSGVGLWQQTTNVLGFVTAGSTRAVIDATGNVGIGTTSPTQLLDINGNLAITGTARRITGDFSNATNANQTLFQTSTANSTTIVSAIPSGTGTQAAFRLYNNSDPTNASIAQLLANGNTDVRIVSGIQGTGTYLPMTFITGGSERVRIDTSGNVGIGNTAPLHKLSVNGNVFASGNLTITSSSASTSTTTGALVVTGGVGIDGNLFVGGAVNNPTVTNYTESVVAIGTVTTASTLSLTNGTVQTATLTASTACTFTMPTATAGKSFVLLLKQAAATGNGTATFTGVKFNGVGAPTITAAAGKMDILSFISDGTNWYGSYTQGYTP